MKVRISCYVGATGFEPAAAWSQTRSATGLRYTPFAKAFDFIVILQLQKYLKSLSLANFTKTIL